MRLGLPADNRRILIIRWLQKNLLFIILAFFFININSKSQDEKSRKGSIIEMKDKFTPLQKIKGDTLSVDTVNIKNTQKLDLPGKSADVFTPEQDSAYYQAMRSKIPNSQKFKNDLFKIGAMTFIAKPDHSLSPEEIAKNNLTLPPSFWKPSLPELVMHQENLERSMYIPYTLNMRNLGGGGGISMNAIGLFLGLTEDVSPVIVYDVEYTTEIEVVVYSIQAVVVSTIVKERQVPGHYKYVWNFRDDKGRPMPSGDYIAEIRIGKERVIRKRINKP